MKIRKLFQSISLVLISGLFLSVGVFAQVETPKDKEPEKIAQGDKTPKSNDDKTDVENDPKEDDDPEKIRDQYTSYLSEYRLGPNDIISIEVFGQCPDYCKTDAIVPPTARLSYPLLRDGVFVGGRTVEEIAADVTKRLDEYIIDPKVTVTLVKAGSARYSVMGKVGVPGVRIMDRKISLYSAIIEAGGTAKGANKRKVVLARSNQGVWEKQEINLQDIEKGKTQDIILRPGDHVIVPGKAFTWSKFLNVVTQISGFRGLLGSPF